MSTKRERHQQLVAERQGKADQLEALRQERAAAIIDGIPFTFTSDLLALESDVAALDQAVATAGDRADEEDARSLASSNADVLLSTDEAIAKAIDRYVAAVAAAEKSVRLVVEALLLTDEVAADIQKLASPYNYQFGVDGSRPSEITCVGSAGMRIRLSERLQQALTPLSPANGTYGQLQWPVRHDRIGESWYEEERALIEREIAVCRRTIAEKIREFEAVARAE